MAGSRANVATASDARRERTLRTIAAAIARHPTGNFQELAQAAGISRATLYRIASSREELLSILTDHAVKLATEALERAGVATREPISALTELTRLFMHEAQFYLQFAVGSPDFSPLAVAPGVTREIWSFYNNSLVDLFRRGQSSGCFRSDFPPQWLRWMYDALLLASVTADLNGELAPADRVGFVMQGFLNGATTRAVISVPRTVSNRLLKRAK